MALVGPSLLLLCTTLLQFVDAHTWIDCMDTDRSKIYDQSASYIFGGSGGNGFCGGYGAGYPGRGDGSIGTEYTFKMLQNEVEAGTAACETVDANTYADWRTRLSVAAGQPAYFAYLPNGHIVKDKKAIGTQHGVYWTGEAGTSLTSTLELTGENLVDGQTMDYDDGNCGESYDYNGNPGGRAGDGKPCIGAFTIPAGTASGIFKMVWFWTFWLENQNSYVDQAQAKGYFGAAYSTCFEVEVTSSGSVASTAKAAATAAPDTSSSAEATNNTAIYKSGATATFSGLESGDESVAGVHAADSNSKSQDYSEVNFDNATEESSASTASSSNESVGTLTDSSVPTSSSGLSIGVALLFSSITAVVLC
ncbi:hypothetical protein PHYPSEUDO_009610 [Phytophthora pseudosyringae]|uniref:DUF7492 domain-containing protein n=1 Tax=Phytophthora pseudosyringae TaxID=221518 RepID=A0A8T1WJ12_9STRA|nr:hypothetical protein PHYPSEUDO_009610 [Phytophthora pseudosyringae]